MADGAEDMKSSLVTDILQKTGCLDKEEVWRSEKEDIQSSIKEILRRTEEAKVRKILS